MRSFQLWREKVGYPPVGASSFPDSGQAPQASRVTNALHTAAPNKLTNTANDEEFTKEDDDFYHREVKKQPDADIQPKNHGFYHQAPVGKTKTYLGWLLDQLEEHAGSISFPKRGYVLQEIIQRLNLPIPKLLSMTANIRRGMQRDMEGQDTGGESNIGTSPGAKDTLSKTGEHT